MNETQKKDFQERIQEVLKFLQEKEVGIFATQQITKEGYIETVPVYRNLKVYPTEKVEAEKVTE